MRLMPLSFSASTLGQVGTGAQDRGGEELQPLSTESLRNGFTLQTLSAKICPSAHNLLALSLPKSWALSPDPHRDPIKGAEWTPL